MKLNNKGFAITLVLYGTLILFLLLIVSLLGILSTYKLRLEKIYPQDEETEIGELTCDFTASFFDSVSTIKITVNNSALLYENKPYKFYTDGEWHENEVMYGGSDEYFNISVKDKEGNEISCGSASIYKRYRYEADELIYCKKKGSDIRSGHPGGNSYYTYKSEEEAMDDCLMCPFSGYVHDEGCKGTSSTLIKNCRDENNNFCSWIT